VSALLLRRAFPYPGDPFKTELRPGYTGAVVTTLASVPARAELPQPGEPPRILDAGCGTGVSTDYLEHLNPGAEILAIDISAGLETWPANACDASRRWRLWRDLRIEQRKPAWIWRGKALRLDQIQWVCCNHLREPGAGLLALAGLLKAGGLLALFLYRKGGSLGDPPHPAALQDLGVAERSDAVRPGRHCFSGFAENNRCASHHEQRWAIDTAAGMPISPTCNLIPGESYDSTGLFRFRPKAAGLNFGRFLPTRSKWESGSPVAGGLAERARRLPRGSSGPWWRGLDPEDSAISSFTSAGGAWELQPLFWTGDEDLLAKLFGKAQSLALGWPGGEPA